MKMMRIGEVAELTGLSVPTLRYYEESGLMAPVSRQPNGHRLYSEQDVYAIRFVMRLRAAGMPIADIRRYIELAQQGDHTVIERLYLLEDHQAMVEEKIAELQEHLAVISNKIAHYHDMNKVALNENLSALEASP